MLLSVFNTRLHLTCCYLVACAFIHCGNSIWTLYMWHIFFIKDWKSNSTKPMPSELLSNFANLYFLSWLLPHPYHSFLLEGYEKGTAYHLSQPGRSCLLGKAWRDSLMVKRLWNQNNQNCSLCRHWQYNLAVCLSVKWGYKPNLEICSTVINIYTFSSKG